MSTTKPPAGRSSVPRRSARRVPGRRGEGPLLGGHRHVRRHLHVEVRGVVGGPARRGDLQHAHVVERGAEASNADPCRSTAASGTCAQRRASSPAPCGTSWDRPARLRRDRRSGCRGPGCGSAELNGIAARSGGRFTAWLLAPGAGGGEQRRSECVERNRSHTSLTPSLFSAHRRVRCYSDQGTGRCRPRRVAARPGLRL